MSEAEASRSLALRAASAVLPAAVVVILAIWEIAVAGRSGDAANAGDWQRAAQLVRERMGPDDLIVFAPDWIDPVGRQHLGDRIPIAMAARMDAARYPVIWELSVRGARAAETRGLSADESHVFGAVTVRHYRQEAVTVLYDFVKNASHGKSSGGRAVVSLEEVGFHPHHCIKVVPPPNKTVSLRFDGVPLGRSLVGYVGLADIFTRRDVRDPGKLELLIDGKSVAEVVAGVDDGWLRFSTQTQSGSTASVEFRLTAVGPKARDRRICFAAEARQ